MRKMRKVIGIIGIILTIIFVVFANFLLVQPQEVNELELFPNSLQVPTFSEIPVNFKHQFTPGSSSKPFLGGAIIDIDNDGRQEIFIGGGFNQDDILLQFEAGNEDGKFVDIISGTKLSSKAATYGANSIDIDNDGDVDLVVARDDGVYVYTNDNAIFSSQKLELQLDSKHSPIGVATGDFDKDGDVDLYVNTFIKPEYFKSATFNDPSNSANDILLRNDGGIFVDVTGELIDPVHQNTFIASFVDLNGDSWQDLVVATNTDQVKIFKNQEGKFFMQDSPTGFGFWMGLGIGDLDNDGDQDLVLSNSGNTIKSIFAKGDLRDDQILDTKWTVLLNDGDFTFKKKTNLPNLGFGWGTVVDDFNLDGNLDVLMSQNYIKWLAHKFKKLPGRFFMQDENGNFLASTEISGLSNPYYGQSPLIIDLNNDGYQDVLLLNINGPLRAFLNNGGSNHYLKVIMPDSAKSLGASLLLETSGKTFTKQFFTSEGYMTDQSPEIIFGLGNEELISLTINWPSGEVEVIKNLQVNSVVVID
jgi:enediyne biosynthesis protein E4